MSKLKKDLFWVAFVGGPRLRGDSGWRMMPTIKRLPTFVLSRGGSRPVPRTPWMPDFPACQRQVLSGRFVAGAAEAPGSAFW